MEGTEPRLELGGIMSVLKVITEPHQFGIHLGIPVHELEKIEKNHPHDVDRQMTEVIKYWHKNYDCSWGALATAVKNMGKDDNLSQRLRELHLKAVGNAEAVVTKPVEKAAAKARSENRLNECPTLRELKKYAWKHVGEKWEELAVLLGLDEDDESKKKLQDIRKERNGNTSMASYDVLVFWQSCELVNPTWEKLIDALDSAGLSDAVKSIKDYLGDNEDTNNQQSPPAGVQQTTKGSQQINHALTNVQIVQPTAEKYTVQMKSGQTVRNYQYELAAPGINGENYIVVAPTNSGKTLVAALIVANHLEKNRQQRKAPRVAVVVKTRPLADQQREKLAEYIPSAIVECRTGNRGNIKERQRQLHIRGALPHSDIIVCTAGKLLDEFKKEMVAMGEFSLIIIDECHNTEKSSNYAQIMYMYLEQKVMASQLPQVIGLTATPGIGKNPGLNPARVIENLITLCAHMDATSGIQTVQQYADELSEVVRKPEFYREVVDQSQQRKAFIQRVEEDMMEYEMFLKLNLTGKLPRWSQKYEQAVKEVKIALEENENPDDRDKISTVRLLESCSQTLISYMELPCAQALDPFVEYDDLTSPDKLSDHEKRLLAKFTKLKSDLASLNIYENPTLEKLEERLTHTFKRNPQSEGIIFVRTREQAETINGWIADSKFAKELNLRSSMLLGHNRPGDKGPSMSDEEQKVIVEAFHHGEYNLLIATSVAEEGLDIKQCNLVIRLYISSARSKAQMQGRARAEDSEIVTIMSNDPKKLYRDILNDELLMLMETLIRDNILPQRDILQQRIAIIQAVIRDNVKKQRELQEARMRTHPAQNVELRCKKCKITACRGSDIYLLDKTGHHVVPGDALDYELMEHTTPGIVDGCGSLMIEKPYKIHCTECNASWGVLGMWPSKKEFPILKCDSFNFFVDGRRVSVPKWKNKPFKASPLSEWLAQTNQL